VTERNYKKEYKEFHKKPEQKKRRAQRNKANRKAKREGRIKKGDGNDVDHLRRNTTGSLSGPTRVVPKSINRAIKVKKK
jgi:hypothetical protein